MYPEELTAGNWGPLNFTVQRTFGCDAAVLFAHLSQIAKRYAAKKTDGWFYIGQPKLIEVTGMTRKPLERSIDILAGAGLLMIDKRGQNNTRHYQLAQSLEQLEAICAAFAAAPAQTPAATKKTAPRANKAANTAKETPNQFEQPIEMAQPVGKTEQLPAEKPKKPKANTVEIDAAAVRLIEHLNTVAGRNFRPVAANINHFARVLRAKEGTEDDVRLVIDFKTSRWGNDPHMRDSLNPETLCRPSKFARYLDEANAAKNQHVSGQRAPSYVVAQDNNLTIELPNGQRFGDYFDRKDQRKVDMIQAQMIAHPGIEKFLPPQLAFKQYLASINDSELQHHLKEARREWRYANYTPPDPNQLPF
jgi:uncharacterized phage protein (TIGR02220 family)